MTRRRMVTEAALVARATLNPVPDAEPIITCIGCSCTDTAPCLNACFWTWMNELTGAGLCSQCATLPLDVLIERLRVSHLVLS
jgi:hypothetical protein